MTDWQPIETAPKDGKPIDLWDRGSRTPDCRWLVPDHPHWNWPPGKAFWCYFHGEWSEWVELTSEPTHWMPLPEPPK